MAHRKLAGRQFAVGLMLLVAESCSCSSRPSADLISEAGGTIEILDGARFARLEVPPGALADPLAITMRFVERRSASSGATVELLPHGAKFARPVSVTLSVDAPAAMAGRPTWVATELDSGRWELLPTSTTGRGSFTGSATHFSFFSLISPCFVAATGTQFSLPECPWRSPEVTSSERVSATINVGQVTLSISTIASTLAASTDFTIDGLLPNWTYYALTRSSPGQAPHTTDAAGRLVLRQQLATDDEVILMEHHGSFVLTPTTCSQVGQWNPATRECTLTQDIVDPPLYVPQDEITVNCADPVTGVPHVIGSSSTRASAGIYAFVTSNAPGNAVKIRNCTVRNADFGLHGALPGFTAENITITNDPTGLAGTAVTLGGGSTGASSTLRGVSVDHFEVGVNSDSASGVTLEDLTIRTSGGGIVTGGNVSISRASLTAIPAVDGGLPIVGGVSLAGAGQVAVRDLRVSGYFAGLWSLSQDMLSLEGASISNSKDGVLLDSSAAAIVSNSTISQNQRGVVSRGVGVPILFHNNIHSNGLNLFSSTAIQASDTRSASPTFRQGNFWGRDCPGPLFVAGTDSNSAAVLDSFPYAAASGWLSDTPGCRSLPAPHILGPIDGALLSTAAVLFTGTVTPGAVVELLESQNVIGRESSTDDGTFRLVPDLPMTNGPHRVTARARSGSAVSTESPPLQFAIATVDTVPPRRPVIVSPTQQALLADNVVAVSGTTESMAMVTILDGASSAVTQADTHGNFTLTLPVASGTHTIVASAQDHAGNVSTSGPVEFTVLQATSSAPITDTTGTLRITRIGTQLNPFVPSSGETNVLTIEGQVVGAPGANGNHVWQVEMLRTIVGAADGQVMATLTSTETVVSTRGQSMPFTTRTSWDGRTTGGGLAPAGAYLSKVDVWIIRDPLPSPLPANPTPCGPRQQPVAGPCKTFSIPQIAISFGLLDAPPPVSVRCGGSLTWWSRAELCNGEDDNCNGSIDENGACNACSY